MPYLWDLKNSYVAIFISENKAFAGGSFEMEGVESSKTHFSLSGPCILGNASDSLIQPALEFELFLTT